MIFSNTKFEDEGGFELGFLLQRAHSVLRGRLMAVLSPFELHLGHFSVLGLIYSKPGLSQARMIEILGIDKSAMVHIVDELEKREFVTREASPTDRRAYSVVMTPVGRERFEVLGKLVGDEQESFFTPIEKDREKLRETLSALVQAAG